MNCKNCKYSYDGHRDALSDICDNCVCDPDTGWGGFTDHSIGKHFNSDEEAKRYYDRHRYDDDDYYNEDDGII